MLESRVDVVTILPKHEGDDNTAVARVPALYNDAGSLVFVGGTPSKTGVTLSTSS